MNLVQQVLVLSDELAQPRRHVERRPYWDRNRNKKYLDDHVTTQPGLLAQLYETAVDPSTLIEEATGGHKKPASRPPLAIEAFSRWLAICRQVNRWLVVLKLEPRDTPEAGLRSIAISSHLYDEDTLDALVQDLKTWRRWSAVMTGWESRVFVPDMDCPVCESYRSIRISTINWEGFCSQCQHSWVDEDDVRRLAQTHKKEPVAIG